MHSTISTFTWTYYGMLLSAALYAAYRISRADKATRFICLWIWLGLLTEVISRQYAQKYHSNLPVYAISCFIELALICLYFNYAIRGFSRNQAGIWIALSGWILGILNILFLQPLDTFNVHFLFLECLYILPLALYALYQKAEAGNNFPIVLDIHFWIPCILIFYQCSTLLSWSIYDSCDKQALAWLHILTLSANSITYLALIILLYFLPNVSRYA